MVYNINNRMLYRGFHSDSTGKNKITKPDGKVVNGKWLYGCMAIVPMPVPDGAKPQMPILCLHSPDRWGKSVGDSSICPCTASLFSGTWMDTNWDDARKADQKDWLARGKTSANWKGIPVFEGDIFWHKLYKKYYVVVYDLLEGFPPGAGRWRRRVPVVLVLRSDAAQGDALELPQGFPREGIEKVP